MIMSESNTSRILTLAFADLADSTALKTQHGDQVVGELITRHRAHLSRLAGEYAGRIVDWAGDGCFLTFDTPSAAVMFSLRLQQAHRLEADLPGVRIGLHLGEVSENPGPDGDLTHPRVEGLAVDLAARICGLARPTQVLMSSAVALSAQQRLDQSAFGQPVQWRAHGSYTLKGVASATEIHEAGFAGMSPLEPPVASEKASPVKAEGTVAVKTGGSKRIVGALVVVIGILIAGLAGWWQSSRPPTPAAPANSSTTPQSLDSTPAPTRKTIAVLPFVNMSSDKENEYFSDGVSEDLITALSKISSLQVVARTSSFAFKGRNEDIKEIGRQLHVGAVLEGSVAKAGNQVRITAQLINTADGYHLWSERYDRDLKDIFAIRSEVAQTVAEALKVTLGAGERALIEHKPTENLEAYQLYLKARYAVSLLTGASLDDSFQYLQAAIASDPNYALPYLGLAYYYFMQVDGALPANEAFPRTRELAEKVLKLDPSLAEAHTILGGVHFYYEHDEAAARREMETALALQPDLASAHQWYGWLLLATGHTEAGIAESRRAVALDPLSPETNTFLGANLYLARRYEEAMASLRATLKRNPDYWYACIWLGRAYTRVGRFPEAISELKRVDDQFGISEYGSALGRAYADSGDTAAASRVLDALRERSREHFVSASFLATVQIGLGDMEGAFASLAQAADEHSYYVPWWRVDPELDPLRDDPRFIALMKKVGLEP